MQVTRTELLQHRLAAAAAETVAGVQAVVVIAEEADHAETVAAAVDSVVVIAVALAERAAEIAAHVERAVVVATATLTPSSESDNKLQKEKPLRIRRGFFVVLYNVAGGLFPYTSRNPEVMSGALCFTGTRVLVSTLFDHLEGGHSLEYFLEGFPSVARDQAVGVLVYSADHLEPVDALPKTA